MGVNNMQTYYKILNLGAGKMKPLDIDKNLNDLERSEYYYLINLDQGYPDDICESHIQEIYVRQLSENREYYCNMDMFDYLNKTLQTFDQVCMYRVLEHISFTQVEYFIYLLSTVMKAGSHVDIVVPDIRKLSQLVIEKLHPQDPDFRYWYTLLTTEIVNEVYDPHKSIWSAEMIKYFWELEKRFKVNSLVEDYEFDGRDIYIRAIIERV